MSTLGQRQVVLSEFEASLVYKASSRADRETQSPKKKKKGQGDNKKKIKIKVPN